MPHKFHLRRGWYMPAIRYVRSGFAGGVSLIRAALPLFSLYLGDPATKNSLDLIGHEDYEIRTILGITL